MRDWLVWVPTVPLPFFGLRKRCVTCGKRFWKIETYERHYIDKHIAEEYVINGSGECMTEMRLSKAIELGYGPWFSKRTSMLRKEQERSDRRTQRRQDRHEQV